MGIRETLSSLGLLSENHTYSELVSSNHIPYNAVPYCRYYECIAKAPSLIKRTDKKTGIVVQEKRILKKVVKHNVPRDGKRIRRCPDCGGQLRWEAPRPSDV